MTHRTDPEPADGLKDLFVEMFDRMVERKDASLIERYYHPEFQLFTNGTSQSYEDFAAGHRRVYATAINYAVRFDDDTWVVAGNRLAVRMWITTTRPDEKPTEIEVVLVAVYSDGRIHRLWELTWPDWSQLQAFDSY